MMWPECALAGTVRISPATVLRRCDGGEPLTIRPPGVRGNAITVPVVIPLPAINSVPWTDTWCGLPLHLAAGTHATLVIRTLVTCGLVAAVGLRALDGATGFAATGA